MNRADLERKAKLMGLLLGLAIHASPNAQTALQGVPVVIDGDNVELNKVRLKLYGVHAPTLKQQCSASGADWPCGVEAAAALRDTISSGGGEISCRVLDPAAMAPRPAVCQQGEVVLNRWLVEQGWALPDVGEAGLLDSAHTQAINAQLGIWRDGFQPTEAWKRVAGVPIDDQFVGCSACGIRHRALAAQLKVRQPGEGETLK